MIWPFRRKKRPAPALNGWIVIENVDPVQKTSYERCTADASIKPVPRHSKPSRSYQSIITTNDYVDNGDDSSSLVTGIAIGMAIESAIDSSSSSSGDTGSFSGDGGSFGGGGSDSSF